jgi:hypothetical protein
VNTFLEIELPLRKPMAIPIEYRAAVANKRPLPTLEDFFTRQPSFRDYDPSSHPILVDARHGLIQTHNEKIGALVNKMEETLSELAFRLSYKSVLSWYMDGVVTKDVIGSWVDDRLTTTEQKIIHKHIMWGATASKKCREGDSTFLDEILLTMLVESRVVK